MHLCVASRCQWPGHWQGLWEPAFQWAVQLPLGLNNTGHSSIQGTNSRLTPSPPCRISPSSSAPPPPSPCAHNHISTLGATRCADRSSKLLSEPVPFPSFLRLPLCWAQLYSNVPLSSCKHSIDERHIEREENLKTIFLIHFFFNFTKMKPLKIMLRLKAKNPDLETEV